VLAFGLDSVPALILLNREGLEHRQLQKVS